MKGTSACGECGIHYPHDLLNPMQTSSGTTAPVCGICALYLSNQFLGTERTRFDGTMAEVLRRKAIKWRNEHSLPLDPKYKHTH